MKRTKEVRWLAGIVCASWMGVGWAQEKPTDQPPSGTQVIGQLQSMSASVQKIDPKKRELILKDDAGTQNIVHVPEQVTRLENVKKGDRVNIKYYEAVALSLKKPGETSAPKETGYGEQAAGKLPGGMVARQIKATAEVTMVDTSKNKLTIKGPSGESDTINVTDPALQEALHKLKKGNKIDVTYSEAVAVSVTPKGQ
jgi:hypothetical protein